MTDLSARSENQSELIQKAREWLTSAVGRQAIKKVIEQSERAQNELMEARRVNPETLNVPVNL